MESGYRQLTSSDLAATTTAKMDSFDATGSTADGRRFRYVLAGGNITAGQLTVAPALVTNHQNVSVTAAAAAGTTSVTVTLGATAATTDQYAEGFLVVGVDGSGAPVTRKIKGNTAGNASASITIALDGREPLLNALTTSNVVSLSPNLRNGVIASTTPGFPSGIAVTSIASGAYGWVQVYGPVGVINDAAGALSALGQVKQSTTVAGAVVASTAATDVQIATMVQPAAASKSALAFVRLD